MHTVSIRRIRRIYGVYTTYIRRIETYIRRMYDVYGIYNTNSTKLGADDKAEKVTEF